MTIDLGDYINGIPMGQMAPGAGGGGGGEAPANMVTLDTDQTITGQKTFDAYTLFEDGVRITSSTAPVSSHVAFSFNDDNTAIVLSAGEADGEVGVTPDVMYIAPGYQADVLRINDYVDGSSTAGIAAKVTITGNLVNKVNGTEYGVLNTNNGIQYSALTEQEYTALTAKSPNTLYRITDTGKVYLGDVSLSSGGITAILNNPPENFASFNALTATSSSAEGYPDMMKVTIGNGATSAGYIRFNYPGSSLPNVNGGFFQDSAYSASNKSLTNGTATGTTIEAALLYMYGRTTVYYTDSLENLATAIGTSYNADNVVYLGAGSVSGGALTALTSVADYVINNFTGG